MERKWQRIGVLFSCERKVMAECQKRASKEKAFVWEEGNCRVSKEKAVVWEEGNCRVLKEKAVG